MAKVRSIFKLQGTLQGITHVHSRSYGYHVRAKRGTYTPAVVNDSFKEMSRQLVASNRPASILNNALDPYCHNFKGRLFQRLVSVFSKQRKEQGTFDFQVLEGFEICKEHLLDQLTLVTATTSIDRDASVVNVELHLSNHPVFKKPLKSVIGYRLNVIAIYPDLQQGTASTDIATSSVIDLKDGSKEHSLAFPVPQQADAILLCVKLESVNKDHTGTTKGMRFVKVLRVGI